MSLATVPLLPSIDAPEPSPLGLVVFVEVDEALAAIALRSPSHAGAQPRRAAAPSTSTSGGCG